MDSERERIGGSDHLACGSKSRVGTEAGRGFSTRCPHLRQFERSDREIARAVAIRLHNSGVARRRGFESPFPRIARLGGKTARPEPRECETIDRIGAKKWTRSCSRTKSTV